MALKKEFDYDGYCTVRETRKLTQAPRVGFEWEVPLDFSEVAPDATGNVYYDDEEGEDAKYEEAEAILSDEFDDFTENNRFNYHLECGGMEFQSPCFQTLTTAKSFAGLLKAEIEGKKYLFDFDQHDEQDCGIHVHVSDHTDRVSNIDYINLGLMLGYLDEDAFIFDLSGRQEGKYYSAQARPYIMLGANRRCLFLLKQDKISFEIRRHIEMYMGRCLRYNLMGTAEFRLFSPQPKVLVPAIEFAHSTFKFIKRYRNKGRSPTLMEYKKWLMKQKGYKTLKNYGDFDLIKNRKKGFNHGYKA